LKSKIDAAGDKLEATGQETEHIDRVQQLAKQSDAVVSEILGKRSADLQSKQQQFDVHFRDLLCEHLKFASEQLSELRARAERAISTVGSEDPAVLVAAAQGASEAFTTFRTTFAQVISGSAEEKEVKKLELEAAATLQKAKDAAEAALAAARAPEALKAPAEGSQSSEPSPAATAQAVAEAMAAAAAPSAAAQQSQAATASGYPA